MALEALIFAGKLAGGLNMPRADGNCKGRLLPPANLPAAR